MHESAAAVKSQRVLFGVRRSGMGVSSVVRDQLAVRFKVLLPHLNERQQRLALATEARLLGHGEVRVVAEVAGVSVTTVRKGVFELERVEDPLPPERAHHTGGCRKSAAAQDPGPARSAPQANHHLPRERLRGAPTPAKSAPGVPAPRLIASPRQVPP